MFPKSSRDILVIHRRPERRRRYSFACSIQLCLIDALLHARAEVAIGAGNGILQLASFRYSIRIAR
jgi:hypothetical protein